LASRFPLRCLAILFDLDGTLLDTLEDIGNSMNRTLSRLGFPIHPIATYKQFVGEGMTMLARRALPNEVSADAAVVAGCVAFMREEYTSHCMDATDVYPGIRELLAELRRLEMIITVLSNKPDGMAQALLKKYFPRTAFDAAFGANESFPSKPDPEGALTIARNLNIPPECFLFLGDSKTDMETANAAGMYPVGALWGFRDASELLKSGAKTLISQPRELLDVLHESVKSSL
jgi:phosphoglycolate phosphatase